MECSGEEEEMLKETEFDMRDNDSENEAPDSGSSDTEDSDDEKEKHNDWEREVVRLRKELLKAPNAYNLHVELIKMLKNLGEFHHLRHARLAMHNIYPLCEELWLEWLQDEKKMVSTNEERNYVGDLFTKAVKDYLSIDIWLEYIQFCLGDNAGLEKAKSVLEDAVRSGGLHVAKGALLWDSYRILEIGKYNIVRNQTSNESLAQAQVVTQLFHRQLSVPLLDMEKTWDEYQNWMEDINQEIDTNVKNAYEKALVHLRKLTPTEDMLLTADSQDEKLKIYNQYLELELTESKDPSRVQALYERAVAELPLHESLWSSYCKFVTSQLKTRDITMPVFERAVRNCPWSSAIWVEYIFAAERYGKEQNFLAGLVEKAFNGGLNSGSDYKNIWLAFIEFVVRKCHWDRDDEVQQLRETFTRACEHLSSNGGDPECVLLQFWAFVEAKRLGNMARARELWRDILTQERSKSAQWRLSYIFFERMHGADLPHVRQLFQKSLSAVPSTDWPESIVQQWLQFEREEGNFETMDTAKIRCEARMKKVYEERATHSVAAEESQGAETQKRRAKGLKRVNEKPIPAAESPAAKKAKNSAGPPGSSVESEPSKETSAPAAPMIAKDPNDPSRHPRTVFVSNLDFKVTEDDLRQILSSSGTITDIRLVRDYKQRSKGYCFVEFSTECEAKSALSRDRETVNGRPMYISPNEADAALKHPVFKYQANLEKNKLFVKGLDTSVTKEELQEMFGQYGALKDVRLVTYRSGLSKGLAYVEYIDDASASTALLQTDRTIFKEKEISVALSQPPPRKAPSAEGKGFGDTSLGGGMRSRKSQVSFVPAAVQRQTKPAASNLMPPPTSQTTPKSNAEFRQMLFK